MPTVRGAWLLVILGLLAACGQRPPETPPEPTLRLTPVAFSDLPGWTEDDPSEALAAFRRSCAVLAKQGPDKAMGNAGTVADWRAPCAAAAQVNPGPGAARAFFEAAFQPFRASNGDKPEGLFTGYYEPLLEGARAPDARFRYPLHKRPPDLVSVDLGAFDPELKGRRIAGRVDEGRLVPYADRAAIDQGALKGRGLELLWVDDAVDKFFLQIQGSGQVRLNGPGHGGDLVRVGYADQNGRPYRAIGRDLIEMGEVPKEKMSMQAIRAWLEANPGRAGPLMDRNPSYVFFRELPELAREAGPLGAQNVPLTPGRSLAVDRKFHALGTPVWLDATAPYPDGDKPLRRLVIAQDTGGAIRGPVRGDVFWGAGEEAEHVAGHMQSQGTMYLLLPKGLTPTS